MRPSLIAVLAFTLSAASAGANAQTSPASAYPAPRFLPGYTHPDITQCQTVGASRRECTVPANVGGRYLVEAVGLATGTGPNATLGMNIIIGEQVCIMQTDGKFKGQYYMHLVCETTLATESPIKIAVNLATRDATLDPGGPKISIRAMPWDGVISVRGANAGPLPTASAAKGAPPPTKPAH